MTAPSAAAPKKTPLHAAHARAGARMVDFGGWSMPVQYDGILSEHHATRAAVGVFDVSHMGEVRFRGPRAAETVQRLVTNDVGKLSDGRAFYTLACNPAGGIVDDLIVYRLRGDHYLIVVNAGNAAKDLSWFREHAGAGCDVVDASAETALIAFQGPRAQAALAPLAAADLAALRPFHIASDTRVAGRGASIARTGYTGEDGFEIFCAAQDAEAIWDALVAAAAAAGGKPVGLGARDTLRLEARLPLYGNDLDDATTPLEAGLERFVRLDGADFIGRAALLRQRTEGVRRRLAGLVMLGRGIARHGYPIFAAGAPRAEAQQPESAPLGVPTAVPPIGVVTSGTVGPTVGKNIALGYVPAALDRAGARVVVDCRGRPAEAEVVAGPFYRRPRP